MLKKLKERSIAALRSGNNLEKQILRVAIGEIETLAMSKSQGNKPVSEEQACKVLRKIIQSNLETIEHSNEEKKSILLQENQVLEAFLPKQLSQDEIQNKLEPVLNQLRSAKSIGQAIGIAMKTLKSSGESVDGNDVKQVVEQLL